MNFKELGENLGLDEDEYRELIELFIQSGSADFQRLQEALVSGDAEKAMRSAHTIKGAAGNLGLMDVHAVAQIIEDNAEKMQLDGLAETMQTLKTQFETIEAFASE